MAGLVLAIHVFLPSFEKQDVDARHKAGHDDQGLCRDGTGGGPKIAHSRGRLEASHVWRLRKHLLAPP
jgi:hypothetical protein